VLKVKRRGNLLRCAEQQGEIAQPGLQPYPHLIEGVAQLGYLVLSLEIHGDA